MKIQKRHLLTIALVLLIGGIAVTTVGLGGGLEANSAEVIEAQESGLKAFLTFGSAMIGSSFVMFLILAQL